MRLILIVNFLLLFFIPDVGAKSKPLNRQYKQGLNYYQTEEYLIAKKIFIKILPQYSGDSMLLFYIGKSYYEIKQYDSAYYFLKEAELKKCHEPELDYYLACTHHYYERFGESKKYLEAYKTSLTLIVNNKELSIQQQETNKVAQLEKMLRIGYEHQQDSLPVRIENVGFPVNTHYSEYASFTTSNDDTLYYTSRAPGKKNNLPALHDNKYHENIFYTTKKNNTWQTPVYWSTHTQKNLHEACVGINAGNDTIYLYRSKKSYNPSGDLYYSSRSNGKWSEPAKLKNVNTRKWEGCANITFNDRWLFFTSDREGGYGGIDIYISEKQSDGHWGEPVNMGKTINTASDEDAPQIGLDDKTLYFSSKSHEGMGGYDIFISKFNPFDSTWSEPVNMGYPINSPADDIYFRYHTNATYAWMSSSRYASNFGEQDIYKVHKPFVDKGDIILRGKIMDSKTKKPVAAALQFFKDSLQSPDDIAWSGETGRYTTSVKTNVHYKVHVLAKGYKIKEEYFNISKEELSSFFYFKNFYLDDTSSTDTTALEKLVKDSPVSFYGNVKEKSSNQPVATMVALFEEMENNLVDLLYSDSIGNFHVLLKPGKRYYLKIADDHYFPLTDSIFTALENGAKTIQQQYLLDRNLVVTNPDSIRQIWDKHLSRVLLQGKILDSKTHEPLEALIGIYSLADTNEVQMTVSDFDGSFSSVLSKEGKYILRILNSSYQLLYSNLDVPDSSEIHRKYYLKEIKNDYDSLFVRLKGIKEKGILKGDITAGKDTIPLSSFAAIFIKGDSIPDEITIAGKKGDFSFILKKDKPYNLYVMDEKWGEYKEEINIRSIDSLIYKKVHFKDSEKKINIDSVRQIVTQKYKEAHTTYEATILDINTKKPIDALIALYTKQEDSPQEVTASDFMGTFKVTIRQHINHDVTVISKGYGTVNLTINTDDSLTMPKIIWMQKLKEISANDSLIVVYKKKLQNKIILMGKVKTIDNQPYITFVALYKGGEKEPDQVVPSDENGSFSFQLGRGEKYIVEIMEKGFLPIAEVLTTVDTISIYHKNYILREPINQRYYDSLQTSWVNKSKTIKTVLYGTILEEVTNVPISAMIGVFLKGEEKPLEVTSSDFDGKFELRFIPNTEYTVRIVAPEYQPVVAPLTNKDTSKLLYKIYYLSPNPKNEKGELVKNSNKLSAVFEEVVKNAVPPEGFSETLSNILFDNNKSTLRKESIEDLDKLWRYMRKDLTMKVQIVGHTDNVGSQAYNKALSLKRAEAVKRYLTRKRIATGRISVYGMGEEQPIVSNDTEEGRQMNRRIEYKILISKKDTVRMQYKTGITLSYSIQKGNWYNGKPEEKFRSIADFAARNKATSIVFKVRSLKGAGSQTITQKINNYLLTQYMMDEKRVLIIDNKDRQLPEDLILSEVLFMIE